MKCCGAGEDPRGAVAAYAHLCPRGRTRPGGHHERPTDDFVGACHAQYLHRRPGIPNSESAEQRVNTSACALVEQLVRPRVSGLLTTGSWQPLDEDDSPLGGQFARDEQSALTGTDNDDVRYHAVSPTPSVAPGSPTGSSHGGTRMYIEAMKETPDRQAPPWHLPHVARVLFAIPESERAGSADRHASWISYAVTFSHAQITVRPRRFSPRREKASGSASRRRGSSRRQIAAAGRQRSP